MYLKYYKSKKRLKKKLYKKKMWNEKLGIIGFENITTFMTLPAMTIGSKTFKTNNPNRF